MSIFSKKTKPLSRLSMFKTVIKINRARRAFGNGNMGAHFDINKYGSKAHDYAESICKGHVNIPFSRLKPTISFLQEVLCVGEKATYMCDSSSLRAVRILQKCLREKITVKESAQKIAEAELLIKSINDNSINIKPEDLSSKIDFLTSMLSDCFDEAAAKLAIQTLQTELDKRNKQTEQPAQNVDVQEQSVPEQQHVFDTVPTQESVEPTQSNAQTSNIAQKHETDKPQWRELIERSPGFVSDCLFAITYNLRRKKEQKTTTFQPSHGKFRIKYAASFILALTAAGFFGNNSSKSVTGDTMQTASLAPKSGITYTMPYSINQPQPVISVLDAYHNAEHTENHEPRIKPVIAKEQSVKTVKKSVTPNSVNTDASDKFYDSRLNMFSGKAGKESLVNKIQKQMNEGNINIDKSISATQIAYAKCIYNKYGYKIDVLESAVRGEKLTSDQNNELANVVLLIGDRGTGVQKLAHEHRSTQDIHEMCAPKKTQTNAVKSTKQTTQTVNVDTAYANATRNYYDSKLDIIAGRKKDAVLSTIRNQFTNGNIKFVDNTITPERLAYVYFLYCEYGLKNAILESAIKDNRRMEPDEIAELTKIILMAGENGTGVQKIAQERAAARGVELNNHSKFDIATRAQKLKFLATKYNWKHR